MKIKLLFAKKTEKASIKSFTTHIQTANDLKDKLNDEDKDLEIEIVQPKVPTKPLGIKTEKHGHLIARNSVKYDMSDTSGWLHECVKNDAIEDLKRILEENKEIKLETIKDVKNANCSLLHTAAKYDSLECMKFLVESGMSLSIKDDIDSTPVFYSVANRAYKTLMYLIDKGANLNIKDKYYNTPLYLALKSGDLESVKILLLGNADINFPSKGGNTVLHLACRMGNVEYVKFLVKHGASAFIKNAYMELPIQLSLPTPEIISFFVEHYSPKDISRMVGSKDERGQTCIHICAALGFLRSFLLLVNVLPINALTELLNEKETIFGNSPIQLSVLCKQFEMLRILVMCKEVDVDFQNDQGDTAMHIACRHHLEEYAQILYEPGKASIKIKNDDGITPKDIAKRNNIKFEKKTSFSILDIFKKKQTEDTKFLGERRYKMKSIYLQNKDAIEKLENPNQKLVEWGEKFLVHVKLIDDKHKRLIDIINQLYSFSLKPTDRWIIGYVLGGLLEYTETHFKEEEELMEKYNYPEELKKKHKEQHNFFVNKVHETHKKYLKGAESFELDLLNFLTNWLVDHILKSDKYLAKHIKENE